MPLCDGCFNEIVEHRGLCAWCRAALHDVQPAMNPASVVWPDYTPDPVLVTVAQEPPRQRRLREEKPVIILNKDWK